MAFQHYKFPLLINIFWDNASEEMHRVASLLYDHFLRNTQIPLDRHLGIPIHRYTKAPNHKELDLEGTVYSTNIILVDDQMCIDEEWRGFAKTLADYALEKGNINHQVLCIAFCKNGLRFIKKKIQAYPLYKCQDHQRKYRLLLIYLTHSIASLIKGEEGREDEKIPITLFLSHAKKDGEKVALALKEHIGRLPELKSFFDAKNISGGSDFEKELDKNIREAVLVVLHTDMYSSREWCRREVLLAKKYERPVIVFNQYETGELRSFPYIGNVPHIRYPTDQLEKIKAYDCIVLEALREVLRVKHHQLRTIHLATYLNKTVDTNLSYPPELISLGRFRNKEKGVIFYPDPPLGKEELNVLEEFCPNIEFATPTLLPLLSDDGKDVIALNLKVAISLSETDKSDFAQMLNQDLSNLMVELTKYLLVGGTQLVYSGKIDYDGGVNYASLIIELVRTYRHFYEDTDQQEIRAIDNFSSYPIYDNLTTTQRADLVDWVNFIPVPAPENLNVNASMAKDIYAFETFDQKYVWTKSLTRMRETMLGQANALIALGGKSVGFRGKMPGVLEEIITAFRLERPIYLIGSFGGITQAIIEALSGGRPDKLTEVYFENHYDDYYYFINQFNEDPLTEVEERIDFSIMMEYLHDLGKADEAYSLNNGLSKAENERLFKSRNEVEIIDLILKGLKTLL